MSKGSNWEREIAKYFTQWLTGQKKEYYFWRSPGSGSVSTITTFNKDLSGDIIPLKEEANILCSNFTIECKAGYPKTTLDNHLKYNKKDFIKEFWEQVNNDANKTNKSPILIYKKKGFKNPWIGIETKTFNKLYKYLKKLRFVHLKWENKLPDTYFFELYEFFELITPEIIKEEFYNET